MHHKLEENRGKFFLTIEGEEIGQMTYTLKGEQMQINHTEVDEAYQGQELGEKLVESGVAYAAEKKWKVLSVCSYAKSVIQKRVDLQHVL